AFGQRLQLRDRDLRVDASAQAAVGRGHDVVGSDQLREALDAIGHELRVLDDVRGMGDDAGDDVFALGQLLLLPYPPFVFVADVGGFEGDAGGIDRQDLIDDLGEREVGHVRSVPGAPAGVDADLGRVDAA